MKTPRLLSVLAIVAVGGAVSFFVLAMPRCGAMADREGGGQSRSFAAVVQAGEMLDAAAARTPDLLREKREAERTAEKAAAVRRARRGFLAWPGRGEKTVEREIQKSTPRFAFYTKKAIDRLFDGFQTGSVDDLFAAPLIYRRELDAVTGDVSKLTPEARAEWDDWEAKGWEGFVSPPTRKSTALSAVFTKWGTPAPRQQALAELRGRCQVEVHALLDIIEEDAQRALPEGEHAVPSGGELAGMKAAAGRYEEHIMAFAAWVRASRDRLMSQDWTPGDSVPPPPPLIPHR